ncbi:MAG: pseudouridine synthase, partial [Candidatus Omnitrophota bacterium]
MYKPKGFISAPYREGGHLSCYECLPGKLRKSLYMVGRLDVKSEGLMLFVSDSNLAHLLSDPSKQVEKEYFVKVRGRVRKRDIEIISQGGTEISTSRRRRGKYIRGKHNCLPVKVVNYELKSEATMLRLVLTEGKYHEIRQLISRTGKAAGLNYEVEVLRRLRFGPVHLGNLQSGRIRLLNINEKEKLISCLKVRSVKKNSLSASPLDSSLIGRLFTGEKEPKNEWQWWKLLHESLDGKEMEWLGMCGIPVKCKIVSEFSQGVFVYPLSMGCVSFDEVFIEHFAVGKITYRVILYKGKSYLYLEDISGVVGVVKRISEYLRSISVPRPEHWEIIQSIFAPVNQKGCIDDGVDWRTSLINVFESVFFENGGDILFLDTPDNFGYEEIRKRKIIIPILLPEDDPMRPFRRNYSRPHKGFYRRRLPKPVLKQVANAEFFLGEKYEGPEHYKYWVQKRIGSSSCVNMRRSSVYSSHSSRSLQGSITILSSSTVNRKPETNGMCPQLLDRVALLVLKLLNRLFYLSSDASASFDIKSKAYLTDHEQNILKPAFKRVLSREFKQYIDSHPEEKLLVFVRHVESMSNIFKYPQTYTRFSAPGIKGFFKQRKVLPIVLRKLGITFDRHISPDLERAYVAVEPLAAQDKKKVEILRRFREARLPDHPGDLISFREDPKNFQAEGYSVRKVDKWIGSFLNKFIQSDEKKVVIGSHGITILLAIMRVFSIDYDKYNEVYRQLGNTPHVSITVLSYNPFIKEVSSWKLLAYGDDSFLREEARLTTRPFEILLNLGWFYFLVLWRMTLKPFGLGKNYLSDYYPSRETFGLPFKGPRRVKRESTKSIRGGPDSENWSSSSIVFDDSKEQLFNLHGYPAWGGEKIVDSNIEFLGFSPRDVLVVFPRKNNLTGEIERVAVILVTPDNLDKMQICYGNKGVMCSKREDWDDYYWQVRTLFYKDLMSSIHGFEEIAHVAISERFGIIEGFRSLMSNRKGLGEGDCDRYTYVDTIGQKAPWNLVEDNFDDLVWADCQHTAKFPRIGKDLDVSLIHHAHVARGNRRLKDDLVIRCLNPTSKSARKHAVSITRYNRKDSDLNIVRARCALTWMVDYLITAFFECYPQAHLTVEEVWESSGLKRWGYPLKFVYTNRGGIINKIIRHRSSSFVIFKEKGITYIVPYSQKGNDASPLHKEDVKASVNKAVPPSVFIGTDPLLHLPDNFTYIIKVYGLLRFINPEIIPLVFSMSVINQSFAGAFYARRNSSITPFGMSTTIAFSFARAKVRLAVPFRMEYSKPDWKDEKTLKII